MLVVMWGIAAIVAGLAVMVLGASSLRSDLASSGSLPVTPLQRLARRGLLLGAAVAVALVVLVVAVGPERVMADNQTRIGFTLLLLAVLVVTGVTSFRIWGWLRRGDGPIDERDRAILERSHGFRGPAILITMAVWVIGLQERFHDAGGIPVGYLHLMFWSCVVVSLVGWPLAILIGYRRA